MLVTAHLDTVFPAGTDVQVRRDGSRLIAPGISDNGSGLASLVAVARAMHEAKIRTNSSIWFVADVGEEGEGNLRGMHALMEAYGSRLKSVIALDGSAVDYVATDGIASRRVEIVITGPGGHSWSDFGAPNPINALARAIAKFVETRVPDDPSTTFNIGDIEGGTSVNSIPASASMKVDLRSEQESELPLLERKLRADVQAGVDEEMAAARARSMTTGRAPLSHRGERPGRAARRSAPAGFAAAHHRLRRGSSGGEPLAAGTQLYRRESTSLGRHTGDFGWLRRHLRRGSYACGMVRSDRPGSGPPARAADCYRGRRPRATNQPRKGGLIQQSNAYMAGVHLVPFNRRVRDFNFLTFQTLAARARIERFPVHVYDSDYIGRNGAQVYFSLAFRQDDLKGAGCALDCGDPAGRVRSDCDDAPSTSCPHRSIFRLGRRALAAARPRARAGLTGVS